MITRDNVLVLKGKTRHGENKIREHGEHWKVIMHTAAPRIYLGNRDTLIESVKDRDARWINSAGDRDFEIIQVYPGGTKNSPDLIM